MPFGLKNAVVTFQQYVNKALHPYMAVFWTTYLDNVLIYSQTFEEHIQYVHQILGLLQQVGLQVKPQKCGFYKTTIKYLRKLVTPEGQKIDSSKVSAVEQ
jgi:hypothetical protein